MATTIIQYGDVRDVVFPLGKVSGQKFEFLGTGFLIGNNGFIMTATHVATKADIKQLSALAVINNAWHPIRFKEVHHHPSEDVSILKIDGDISPKWPSWIVPSNSWEGSSCPYQLWGYPEIYAKQSVVSQGKALDRPDLCYYEGHIVRRITQNSDQEIINVKGSNLFELSVVGYSGCSGAPVIKKEARLPNEKWKLIGVYIGNPRSNIQPEDRCNVKEFLKREEKDITPLLKDKHTEELFNLINDYSSTLIREYYHSSVAVREEGIKESLMDIDPSLYQ